MSTVLVTGGSGFIGSHAIVQLLDGGPRRAHHRARPRARAAGARHAQRGRRRARRGASLLAADLETGGRLARRRWPGASTCCTWPRPFPLGAPKHEDELILPAREGALRVLRAARDAGVRRVVLTSSFAAIGYGHKPRRAPFDERDWTDLERAAVRRT